MTARGCLALAAGLPMLMACSPAYDTPRTARPPVRSFLEARHASVVIQKWDISCGSAALATILTYQHGDQVSEREVAAAMLRRTSVDLVKRRLGFSLLDLKRYAESRGFTADGYGDMTLQDLLEAGPTIVPVQMRGLPHFVIFRGIQGDRVLLADPAFGNRTMTIAAFERVWQGRMGFTVSRTDGRTVPNLLAAKPADFWASSLAFGPARREGAVLMASAAAPVVRAEFATPEGAAAPPAAEAASTAAEPAVTALAAGTAPSPVLAAATVRAADAPPSARPASAIPPARTYASASGQASGTLFPAPVRRQEAVRAAEIGSTATAAPAATAVHAAAVARAAPPDTLAAAQVPPAEVMRRRGDAMLALGDVSAARLLYERAAAAGSGGAARALGETYDPAVLGGLGVHGPRPDAAAAAAWYRRALALGDAEAAERMRRLRVAGTE